MVDKFGREIHNGDVEVLLVDELVKMIAHKGLHFGVSHLRLGIHGLLRRLAMPSGAQSRLLRR